MKRQIELTFSIVKISMITDTTLVANVARSAILVDQLSTTAMASGPPSLQIKSIRRIFALRSRAKVSYSTSQAHDKERMRTSKNDLVAPGQDNHPVLLHRNEIYDCAKLFNNSKEAEKGKVEGAKHCINRRFLFTKYQKKERSARERNGETLSD